MDLTVLFQNNIIIIIIMCSVCQIQQERLDSEGLPSPTEECSPDYQAPSPTSTLWVMLGQYPHFHNFKPTILQYAVLPSTCKIPLRMLAQCKWAYANICYGLSNYLQDRHPSSKLYKELKHATHIFPHTQNNARFLIQEGILCSYQDELDFCRKLATWITR
jgi:hypothetical protein